MGTVALIDNLTDARNVATLLLYVAVFRLVWTAFIRGDTTVVMVSLIKAAALLIC